MQKIDFIMTYKERKEQVKVLSVVLNCELLGTWSNLKKLCDEISATDAEFLSYSSLSKKRSGENPITFTTSKGSYSVYIEKLK